MMKEQLEDIKGQGLSQKEMISRLVGDHEPDWSEPIKDEKDRRFEPYYNWCNVNFNAEKLHGFIVSYMKNSDYSAVQVEQIKQSPVWTFLGVPGMIARLINNNIEIPTYHKKFLINKIALALEKAPMVSIKELEVKETIQDRMQRQAWEWMSEAEGAIDDKDYKFSFYDYLTEKKVGKPYISFIQKHFAKQVEELYDAYEKLNDDIVESYKPFGQANILKRLQFIKKLIDDCNRYSAGIKTVRKSKKKKSRNKAKWTKVILKGKKKVKK